MEHGLPGLRLHVGRWLVILAAILALGLGAHVGAAPPSGDGAVELEVFVREGCPHCAEAKIFLEQLRSERPGLRLSVRDIERDAQALERLRQLLSQFPGVSPGVPAFYVNGELHVGYAGAQTTGAMIRGLLDRAAQAPAAAGSIALPWIGRRVDIEDVGLPLFTVVIGLLDGFNPCSMWVLVLMVSMLAAVGDRRRMIAIAGTFVLIQGLAYYAFMAAWLNVFLVIGISRASEVILGLLAMAAGLVHVKDYVAFGRGISLSIPAAAKPGIYQRMRALLHEQSLLVAIAGTVLLAILVQIVELLCTSGLPALYTRILTLRGLDPWHYYGYLALYNAMYMLDDVVLLAVGVVTLSQKRLQEKEGRRLKLLSGAIMVLLGIYLVFVPH